MWKSSQNDLGAHLSWHAHFECYYFGLSFSWNWLRSLNGRLSGLLWTLVVWLQVLGYLFNSWFNWSIRHGLILVQQFVSSSYLLNPINWVLICDCLIHAGVPHARFPSFNNGRRFDSLQIFKSFDQISRIADFRLAQTLAKSSFRSLSDAIFVQ